MGVKKSYETDRSEYTVSYSGMRGVNFSEGGGNSKRYRYSYLENMYRDYTSGGEGVTESVPGFRYVTSTGKKTHALYSHKDGRGNEYIVVHAGSSLYRFAVSERDSLTTLSSIATLKNQKSHGFTSGSDLYIFDGEKILRVSGNGTCTTVGDDSDAAPYIPTTYQNGREYEQRNLLTNKFRERYLITAASDNAVGSEGLFYKILSTEDKTAAVSGVKSNFGGALYIPAYVMIGDEKYAVTAIEDHAFELNSKITSVVISDTVTRIGKSAFYGCTALTNAVTGEGVSIIDTCAFLSCHSLTTVYLGTALKEISYAAFNDCTSLYRVYYSDNVTAFSTVKIGTPFATGVAISYETAYDRVMVSVPIFSPASSVLLVTADNVGQIYSTVTKNSLVTGIQIECHKKSLLDGKEICVTGIMDSKKFAKNTVGTNFLSEKNPSVDGASAIIGCTVCECFDGRVFLSGNPSLPNTVFYSSRDDTGRNNPLYFGVLNYFNDGTGSFGVESMLAVGDSLAVFKSGDDGGGSIYYHTPKDTDINILPRIYPVSYIHSGISAIGPSISFFDDPIFLSSLGCTALDKQKINLSRSVVCRSSNVNAKLLSEDLSSVSLAKWCGYLVVQAGENIYLADSRQTFVSDDGHCEYEWYYLTGIGTYYGAIRVFKFKESAREGYFAHPTMANEKVTTSVRLTMDSNGEAVYYTTVDGVKYEVYTDGENTGGVFYPAKCICVADGDIFFFATGIGDICVMNNDRRGVAPPYIAERSDFDTDEYAKNFGNRIHPYYYSHDGRAISYAVKTVSDDGGIPHLTKNTVKNSLAIKVRCLGQGDVTCEVGTDRSGYSEITSLPDGAIDFWDFDFSSLSFENCEHTTLALKEREKRWIEKSLSFYTKEFLSPFGIYSATYRFFVKGRIKHKY